MTGQDYANPVTKNHWAQQTFRWTTERLRQMVSTACH